MSKVDFLRSGEITDSLRMGCYLYFPLEYNNSKKLTVGNSIIQNVLFVTE